MIKLKSTFHVKYIWKILLIFLLKVYDSNTLYLDEEQQTYSSSEGIYMTQSYACGSVFTVSILDFLASAVCIHFMKIRLGWFKK